MSKFYSIVQRVINASDLHEAGNILYGVDGVLIKSEEYYKNIVSNFIKRKETIIQKKGNRLVFDLENYNDMWNIIFLGEYIKENDVLRQTFEETKSEIISEFEKKYKDYQCIVAEHGLQGTIDHFDINNRARLKEQEIKEYLKEKLDLKEEDFPLLKKHDNCIDLINNYLELKYKGIIETFYKIDWVELENSNDKMEQLEAITQLKQAINIIHKLRNNIEHGGVKEDKKLRIHSDNFKVSIPIEYIDGFNKGRIIARSDDAIIVEKTNRIASPLLETLDYDIKKIDSFFYNVNPDWLSFLLEQVNYDYGELYKFNPNVFSHSHVVKFFLKNNIDLKTINNLPDFAYKFEKVTFRLLTMINPDDLNDFTSYVFNFVNKWFFKFLHNELSDWQLDFLVKAFQTKKKRDNNKDIKLNKPIKILEKIEDKLFENEKINNFFDKLDEMPEMIWCKPISVIKISKKMNSTIKALKDLPDSAFENQKSVRKFLKKISAEEIKKLPDSAFEYMEETMILLDALDVDVIKELPIVAFFHPESTIKLLEIIDIKEMKHLPNEAYYHPESAIKLLEIMNIEEIKHLPVGAWTFIDSTIELYKKGNFVWEAFNAPETILSFLDELSIEKINKLPKKILESPMFVRIENIKYLLEIVNNDYDKLEQFPIEFFNCNIDIVDEMYKTYNMNVARSIFGINNPKLIAALVYCDSVFKKYDRDNGDYNIVELDPIKIIHSSLNDTYKYKNNIADVEINRETYLNQFIFDEDGVARDYKKLKAYILDKLRNSTCHFRFKQVKDSEGIVVPDKVYLYDRYDDSTDNNFNIIMDMKKLVEIARQVELDLSKKREDFEVIDKDKNRFSAK